MSNVTIRAELEARLQTWADAQNRQIPIAFEGWAFNKEEHTLFLEPLLAPVVTLDRELSATRKTRLGIFSVNIWAKSGNGMRTIETMAQSIVELFPILPKQGTVSIEATPHAGDTYPDPSGWMVLPVTIQYRHETY